MKIFTKEEREAGRVKAALTRQKRKEAATSLKTEYADENHWRELASRTSFRLANREIPASQTKYLKRILAHLELDVTFYQELTGFSKSKDFSAANPTWTAMALQGLILESYYAEGV